MKIFRSELSAEFKDRLFDITVGALPNHGSRFKKDTIQCILSSTKVQFGFHLAGSLSAMRLYECDRCLKSFSLAEQIHVNLWLASNRGITAKDEPEVIFFPDSMDVIELAGIFAELLFVSEPMKKLCNDQCKGFCPQCGINLNHGNCICESGDSNNP